MNNCLSTSIGTMGLAVLSLVLVGCNPADEPAPENGTVSESEELQGEANSVQTYTTDVEESIAPIGDRLPADPARTVLIPATSLFPGTTAVAADLANPYAGDEKAIARGEQHFGAFNCNGCHAPLGGGGMGPPLSDEVWIYGGEPGQVYLSILHGRPAGMPAWGSMLPEKTIWELVAYIDTLDEIENYAAKKGFDENVEGYREIDSSE
ncbi:c-type cytochrome [Hydrocarboniclastica marina]|uniref:Di-heme cytochrome c n=1 Tax=Hydrocarboniclastica marina TaxID=2259620 RepID=A0A4P7XJD2_9ALTE|nr:c-type cytochrome [Hydrocarboniclastica marina]QCF26873.1 di-heme cytochrome c [Hydrocarboniclastica marina]